MPSDSPADRRAMVSRILADPPNVHALDGEDVSDRRGLWRTAEGCYELLCRKVEPGSRTLETGLGLSTALFAALGAEHTCVVSIEAEAERLLRYCERLGVSTQGLRVEVGYSDDVLPRLSPSPLDLVFIDGGHGFPIPTIDWHYATRTLEVGGLAVIDDAHLPAVHDLVRIVDLDPRWSREHRAPEWAAFRRLAVTEGVEDWWQQSWLPLPRVTRLRGRVRRLAARVRQNPAS